MSLLLFILSALCISQLHATTLHHQEGGGGDMVGDHEFHKRLLLVGQWNVFNVWSGTWFNSIEVDSHSGLPNFNGDFIWGSTYVGAASFPTSWMAYWTADSKTDRNVTNPDKVDWNSFSVRSSSGYMATAFLSLLEKNSDGDIERELPFNQLLWYYNTTKSKELSNTTKGLYADVYDCKTSLSKGSSIQLRYFITEHSIHIDGIPVVPKSIESIIKIDNWHYKHPSNALVLRMAVGHTRVSFSSASQIKSGKGDEQLFFRVADEVEADRSKKDVKVSWSRTDDITRTFRNRGLESQLRGRYGKDSQASVIEIQFPVDAKKIVYDPTMGAGKSPFDDHDRTRKGVAIGLGILGGLLLLSMIVGIVLFLSWRRREYSEIE